MKNTAITTTLLVLTLLSVILANNCFGYSYKETVIATIVMESSNDWDEIVAVANVINNRARKSKKPMDWVVSRPKQFLGYNRRHLATSKRFVGRWEAAQKALELVEAGEVPDNTNGCLNFRSYRHTGKKIGSQWFF